MTARFVMVDVPGRDQSRVSTVQPRMRRFCSRTTARVRVLLAPYGNRKTLGLTFVTL